MDRKLVNPELQKSYRFIPAVPVGNRLVLKTLRAMMPLARKVPPPADVRLEVITLERGGGARVYTPTEHATGAALLWIHGGGMVIGAASQDDGRCFEAARRLGAVVVSVDYRLAPEHPYPAPLDDCFDAWNWMLQRAADRGIDPARFAVGGQSAGGGLAASVVQRIHDSGGPQPAAQWLFCPMLDDRTAARTELDAAKHILWNNKANRAGWSAYLGVPPGSAFVPDGAVPARRLDLAGLPAAWIGTGDIELFYEENRAYAEALRTAGVECELDVVAGAPHAFETLAGGAQVSQAYLNRSYDWLQGHLAI